MTPMAHTLRRLLPMFLLLASRGPVRLHDAHHRPPKALEITDVETGFFDAGVVDGKNKLVPTIAIR